jgi:hypothetical protein
MIRRSCFAVALAALVAAPLAAAVVLVSWFRMTHAGGVPLSPAHWSSQTFVTSFDVLVLLMWLPCASWISRMRARVTAGLLDGQD